MGGLKSSRRSGEGYLDWFDTQTSGLGSAGKRTSGWLAHRPEMRVRRGPGNTCLSALGAGGQGTMSRPVNDSKGCGGAMRVAPIGLTGSVRDTDTVFRLAAEAAALTHGHRTAPARPAEVAEPWSRSSPQHQPQVEKAEAMNCLVISQTLPSSRATKLRRGRAVHAEGRGLRNANSRFFVC